MTELSFFRKIIDMNTHYDRIIMSDTVNEYQLSNCSVLFRTRLHKERLIFIYFIDMITEESITFNLYKNNLVMYFEVFDLKDNFDGIVFDSDTSKDDDDLCLILKYGRKITDEYLFRENKEVYSKLFDVIYEKTIYTL